MNGRQCNTFNECEKEQKERKKERKKEGKNEFQSNFIFGTDLILQFGIKLSTRFLQSLLSVYCILQNEYDFSYGCLTSLYS